MLVAAGARRLGRETLKAHLKKRIASGESPVEWLRITGVAATLCLVAGLGVYYLAVNRSQNPPPVDAAGREAPGASGEIAQNRQSAPREGLAVTGGANKVAQLPGASPPAPLRAQAKQKEAAPTLQSDRYTALNEERGAGGIARSEPARGASQENAEFWSEGTVEGAEGSPGAAALKKAGAEAAEKPLISRSDAARDIAPRRKDAPAIEEEKYVLRQRPASALPADRENHARDRMKVPTQIEKTGGRTTLTMYLDSLVDENEMRRAHVDAPGDDSVVVTVGGKKILYRLHRGGETEPQRK